MRYPDVAEGCQRVVFDLDGTLAVSVWPESRIGAAMQDGVDALLHYVEEGYEVVIWTSRPASHEERIWRWLRDHGLENAVYDVVCGKPQAGLYLDDRAVTPAWT